ncbi:Nif3-like dinuclear metal center hexameric protein [Thiomicrorhabdus lithotrophica]|uniref:Nif3-like dinuclear metal center hexameric protein n=1 Tax=Thiomicrorhabdus lithotrophica TaxID=2949997 RepID=A0ABY8CB51_9GAMM|nr:Nif3-like dinuclear metal center hexameric protein [Thiomicrorhabdus lithotrophica]WEJ63206.1 Nif3-like dinuclear metal center hexameric protein [Thiomicrorhabdus lithotrophica]
MLRTELESYLKAFLNIDAYKDYAPNGLQVEGKNEIQKIVTGVTACQALIDAAIELKADAILVHHGYFWKSEPEVITGFKQKRIKSLLMNDMSLFAYHLPLDGHEELGNNAQLGKLWQLQDITPEPGLVRLGELKQALSINEFVEQVSDTLDRQVLHLPGGPEMVKTVAWCSGGAQGYINQAIDWSADVYISGEVSEQTTHLAKECGIHYLAAGHHATERVGVKALGEHLAEHFGLECIFVDIGNPV